MGNFIKIREILDKYNDLQIEKHFLLRLLVLHLYRYSSPTTFDREDIIKDEIKRLSEQIKGDHRNCLKRYRKYYPENINLIDTKLRIVSNEVAIDLHKNFHYLKSPRPNGIHLGLFPNHIRENNYPGCLITLSDFDLPHLMKFFPDPNIKQNEIMVTSRVFTYETMPCNTISYTLKKVRLWLKNNRPSVRMLMTYIDPNLGFTGCSMKADNWIHISDEKKERYLYLNEMHISNREVVRRFGSAVFENLQDQLGSRIQKSNQPLQPLSVYIKCFA